MEKTIAIDNTANNVHFNKSPCVHKKFKGLNAKAPFTTNGLSAYLLFS